MKYYELELDGEIIRFRLTTGDCKIIEKKSNMSIIEYIQNISITTICNLIMYMRRSEIPNYSERDAEQLIDKLIDNGYSLKDIMEKVIQEGLIVSGFLTKTDLQKAKEEMKATENKSGLATQ